jgi:hypothetical protein
MDFETLAAAGYFFPYLCTELNISYFLALFFSIPLTEYVAKGFDENFERPHGY